MTSIRQKGDTHISIKKITGVEKKIDVIVVSVNYNDFLSITLEQNIKIFDNITVVTSESDEICKKLCDKFGVKCIQTNIMYENGNNFNKGKAINLGIKSIENPEFILLLDADCIVGKNIDRCKLDKDILYTSGRIIIESNEQYERWKEDETSKVRVESNRGLGFFHLFDINSRNINKNCPYPDNYPNADGSDLVFRNLFNRREDINNKVIHLGVAYKNWRGRKSENFITIEKVYEAVGMNVIKPLIIEDVKKSKTFTICSYYFNFRDDVRQKNNFIKFLDQFKNHYDKMIVGVVDYGDIDFEIPCEKIIIKGDPNNKLWSKEIIINKIVNRISTDYLIWIDGDLIYENLDWLNNIEGVAGENDFVQLFENINYLGPNGEIQERHKSIASTGRSDIDQLMRKGYKPGGSWLGRVSILKEKKMFEKMYVGGGDSIFYYGCLGNLNGHTLKKVKENNEVIYKEALEWIRVFGRYKLGYLPQSINHLYHGDLLKRDYENRYIKLNQYGEEIDVTILILAHKESEYLDKCISSAKSQKFNGNFEILLSSDSNSNLKSICEKHGIRFTLAEKPYRNTSCSFNFNHGVKESKGRYIKYLSYDDWLSEGCIQSLYDKIKDSEYSLIHANSNDTFNNGRIQKYIPSVKTDISIEEQCIRNQIHGGTIMFRRDDFLQVGGLNENLIYAEEYDFYFNLLSLGKKIGYLDKFVYNYRRHNEQKGTLSLSEEERKNKSKIVESIKLKYKKDKIICGIATVKGREESLKDTVESIIEQVDKLIVYQNGYKNIFDFLRNDKIEVISSLDTGIDMGDAGKFYKVNEFKNCYYLSIDDDLIYPNDYVEAVVKKLKKYNNKIILSFHGRILDKNLNTYYNGHLEVFRCLDEVKYDKFIHFGGTGVMGFHTSVVNISFDYFEYPNMADIWIGLFARENNIPILCSSHNEKWIIHTKKINLNETIFRKSKNNDSIQNHIISNFDREKIIKYKKTIIFLTCTYERIEITKIFKKNLIKLQEEFSSEFNFINIVVDSDHSNRDVFQSDDRFIYLEYGNSPLSHKWNYGSQFLKNINFDNLIIIGSDDILDCKLFNIYKEKIKSDMDLIGIKDLYMYDILKDKMFYWSGYDESSGRLGESIGLARCLSKKIVEELNYNLWGLELNKGLDKSMMERITKYCDPFSSYIFNSKDNGFSFDIKSNKNITILKNFDNLLEIKNFDIKKYL
jgi:glycosyltransferase involved in cell wall biosynthesis